MQWRWRTDKLNGDHKRSVDTGDANLHESAHVLRKEGKTVNVKCKHAYRQKKIQRVAQGDHMSTCPVYSTLLSSMPHPDSSPADSRIFFPQQRILEQGENCFFGKFTSGLSRKYLHWICHTDELNGGAGGSAATRRVRQEKRSLSDTLGEFLQEWIESNQDGTSEDMTRAQKKFKGKGSQVSIGNKGRSPGESGTSQSYGKAAGKNPAAKSKGKGKATKTGHPQDKFPQERVVEAEDKAEDRNLARQLIDVLKQCLNKGCSDVQVATILFWVTCKTREMSTKIR